MKHLLFIFLIAVSSFSIADNLLEEYGQGQEISLKSGNTFNLVSWNIYKGGMEGLYADLESLIQSSDFVLMQEFLLNTEQQEQIAKISTNHWGFAKSFQDGGEWTGVATTSLWKPSESVVLKSPGAQPLAGTPKMTLVTKYQLKTGDELWIVNLHGLNFDITHGVFMEQIEFVVSKIKNHSGPMIFAGDFNTWSTTRFDFLIQKTEALGLVRADMENPLGFFSATLDHIFYRGLKNVSYRVMTEIESSDHNPLQITFEL